MKYIKNTTASEIYIKEVGYPIAANSTHEIHEREYLMWFGALIVASSNLAAKIDSGDLVVNDGYEDLVATHGKDFLRYPDHAWNARFDAEPQRPNGFYLDDNNVQEAIEYAKSDSINNDLDKLQFGRQGQTSANTVLLTLNNINSYDSPDTLKYDIIFRGFSVSTSNEPAAFTIQFWKVNADHSIRTMIYEETFSVVNSNFTGHSGFTIGDLSIPVDAGFGVYVVAAGVGNPKPSDLNCVVWTRQR